MSVRIGFVSTYQPTRCGLATFTQALLGALTGSGEVKAEVVRVFTGPQVERTPHAGSMGQLPEDLADVIAEMDTTDARSTEAAAASLDAVDVAIIQFEYGIFGGLDGEQAVTLLDQLRVPSIVVLHTVLSHPSDHQREVLEQVSARADSVVVMTDTARRWLLAGYQVDPAKVTVIPHGAGGPLHGAETSAVPVPTDTRLLDAAPIAPTILTWGLIGPGKGIEWGIDAVALLSDLTPRPRYVVAGQTHPKVLERDGERYRESLQRRAQERGVAHGVVLDDVYRGKRALASMIDAADVVLLPYDSREQISSGVLIEAVAAGVPVVATKFPHAIELLASGAGLLVEQQDPADMAAALRLVLTDPARSASMRAATTAISDQVSWAAVAASYRVLTDRLVASQLVAG